MEYRSKISRWTVGRTFVFRPYYKFKKPKDIKFDVNIKDEVDRFFIYQEKTRSRFDHNYNSLDEALSNWKRSTTKIDPSIYFCGFYNPSTEELTHFIECMEDIHQYLVAPKYSGDVDEWDIRNYGNSLYQIGGISAMYCAMSILEKVINKFYLNTFSECWDGIGDFSENSIGGIDYWEK